MPWDIADDESTLVQLMAWCRQATSHYLNQCWPRSMWSYGITRPLRLAKNNFTGALAELKVNFLNKIGIWWALNYTPCIDCLSSQSLTTVIERSHGSLPTGYTACSTSGNRGLVVIQCLVLVQHYSSTNMVIWSKTFSQHSRILFTARNGFSSRFIHFTLVSPNGLSGWRGIVVACVCLSVRMSVLPTSLKRKCRHFDEILVTGCIGSCHFDDFRCSQWWKISQMTLFGSAIRIRALISTIASM